MPDVSILIVNWNTRERLRACLGALASLTDAASREVVVIDNGSTDGSSDLVVERFPSVRLLRNERNEGFARAVNRGVAETGTPFLLLLNSDALVQPGAIDALVSHLRQHADVAAAGAQLYKPDGCIQHAFDLFPSLATELLNKGLLRRLFPARYPSRLQIRTEPLEVDSLIGACMMMRRAAIEAVGGLDPRYFVFYEETDWCLRARRRGWRIVLVPGARAVHGQGETKAHHPGRARVESWRSRYAYFDKHHGRLARRLLETASFLRLGVQVAAEAIGVFVTAGLQPVWRRKLSADAWLFAWHAAGCPSGWGFGPSGPCPGYVLTDGVDGRRWMPVSDALSLRGSPLYRLQDFMDTEAAHCVKENRSKRHLRVSLARDGVHEPWIVKFYKRGSGLDRLKRRLRGSRALRELRLLLEAQRRGVPVSPPSLAVEWSAGRHRGESALVFPARAGWETLDARLRRAGMPDAGGCDASRQERRALIRGFGRFARDVFDAGVDQDDFNPTNVMVRSGSVGEADLVLVDFERVVIRPVVPTARRVWLTAKMLREPAWAGRTDRMRFLGAMSPGDGGREARHAFARAVAAAWGGVQARDRRRGKR